jgi:hypothetical protein
MTIGQTLDAEEGEWEGMERFSQYTSYTNKFGEETGELSIGQIITCATIQHHY